MRISFWIGGLALALACQSAPSDHGHAHGPDESAHDHGDERPRVDTTIWTERTELFVEYPALVMGEISRFAAHFTRREGHRPVGQGAVSVSLIQGQRGIKQRVAAPRSPGIFAPALQPEAAGIYQLVFDLQTPDHHERIAAGKVEVYPDWESAAAALGTNATDNSGEIGFFKEQAWQIPFQTSEVVEGQVFEVVPTSGQWMAAPSDYQQLVAPASGVVSMARESLTVGSEVGRGQLLLTLSSEGLTESNLAAEIQQAQAAFDQVKAEYERKQALYADKIVPRSAFEQVERRYRQAKTRLETLGANYGSRGKQVRAPFDGFVKQLTVGNGDYVAQGQALLSIGADRSRLLQVGISPAYAHQLDRIHDLRYRTQTGAWASMKASGGQIQSVGREVSATEPLLPIFARVNQDTGSPEGSFTEVHLELGQPREGLMIPVSALLENYGQYSVIVQLGGESFEQRPVQIGRRSADQVEVLSGLSKGDHVVSQGAYQVKMAAMSGQVPGHGHAH